MVGLSVVLESQKTTPIYSESSRPQVINKATMIKPSSPTPTSRKNTPATLPATGFLDRCFLCDRKLLPGKDIYMYKGDRGFCSEECRCRQIFMDEEEALRAKTSSDTYYSWSAAPAAAVKKPQSAATSSSSSASGSRRGIRNRAGC